MVKSHIITCSTVISDENTSKYVEVLVPSITDTYCKKYLITAVKHSSYMDYCWHSVANALRRYHIDEEQIANWTNKCLWCPQKGRCKGIRDRRGTFGRVPQ